MKIAHQVRPLAHAFAAALMLTASATIAGAQGHDDHGANGPSSQHKPTPQDNALVKAVRDATDRFKHVTSVAGPGEGYELAFGCVSGGDFGAMGLHYVNMSLVDGVLDVNQPEIVLFEPTSNGGIRITGVDFLVPAAAWNAAHAGPPQLMGQLFHLFDSPNRFGLEPFYTLHVWAWKNNPAGTFTNWNPDVSCDAFNARTPSTTR
jgi:hypothetical protein